MGVLYGDKNDLTMHLVNAVYCNIILNKKLPVTTVGISADLTNRTPLWELLQRKNGIL